MSGRGGRSRGQYSKTIELRLLKMGEGYQFKDKVKIAPNSIHPSPGVLAYANKEWQGVVKSPVESENH